MKLSTLLSYYVWARETMEMAMIMRANGGCGIATSKDDLALEYQKRARQAWRIEGGMRRQLNHIEKKQPS